MIWALTYCVVAAPPRRVVTLTGLVLTAVLAYCIPLYAGISDGSGSPRWACVATVWLHLWRQFLRFFGRKPKLSRKVAGTSGPGARPAGAEGLLEGGGKGGVGEDPVSLLDSPELGAAGQAGVSPQLSPLLCGESETLPRVSVEDLLSGFGGEAGLGAGQGEVEGSTSPRSRQRVGAQVGRRVDRVIMINYHIWT